MSKVFEVSVGGKKHKIEARNAVQEAAIEKAIKERKDAAERKAKAEKEAKKDEK